LKYLKITAWLLIAFVALMGIPESAKACNKLHEAINYLNCEENTSTVSTGNSWNVDITQTPSDYIIVLVASEGVSGSHSYFSEIIERVELLVDNQVVDYSTATPYRLDSGGNRNKNLFGIIYEVPTQYSSKTNWDVRYKYGDHSGNPPNRNITIYTASYDLNENIYVDGIIKEYKASTLSGRIHSAWNSIDDEVEDNLEDRGWPLSMASGIAQATQEFIYGGGAKSINFIGTVCERCGTYATEGDDIAFYFKGANFWRNIATRFQALGPVMQYTSIIMDTYNHEEEQGACLPLVWGSLFEDMTYYGWIYHNNSAEVLGANGHCWRFRAYIEQYVSNPDVFVTLCNCSGASYHSECLEIGDKEIFSRDGEQWLVYYEMVNTSKTQVKLWIVPYEEDPTILITSPTNGNQFTPGSEITIEADYSGMGRGEPGTNQPHNSIEVKTYVNGQLKDTDSDCDSDYQYFYTPPSDGEYGIKVVAKDFYGNTNADSIHVTVGSPAPVVDTLYYNWLGCVGNRWNWINVSHNGESFSFKLYYMNPYNKMAWYKTQYQGNYYNAFLYKGESESYGNFTLKYVDDFIYGYGYHQYAAKTCVWYSTTGKATPETEEISNLPQTYSLLSNYPNPFNPTTTISYTLPEAGNVNLAVYNINGQLVNTLVNEYKNAGMHNVIWNSTDASGNTVTSGVYFYRIETGDFAEAKQMMLVK